MNLSTEGIGEKNLEQFTNLFKSRNITYVNLWIFPNSNGKWQGNIKYISGDLEGEKKFKENEFKDLVIAMETFIKNYK